MILPSSRGTAASHAQKEVTVTKNVFNNNKSSCVRVSVYWSLCMCLCLYQQLQPSAAEPAVSWCLVNNQRTPGHTPAHIYMPPAPLCSAHSPLLLSLFLLAPSVSSHTVLTSWCQVCQPKSTLLSGSCFHVCPCTSATSWHTPCGNVICAPH